MFHITTNRITSADSDMDENHIILPESDDIPNHLTIPDSDSSLSSQIHFPVSDGEGDLMDMVRSDQQNTTEAESDTGMLSRLNSESESDTSDLIMLPESPVAMRGAITGFERDPNSGRFTAASFTNFPDDLFD